MTAVGDARKRQQFDQDDPALTLADLLAAYLLGQKQHREHPRVIDPEFLACPTASELLATLRAEAAASQTARLAEGLRRWGQ